ncbi:MAG: GNAT family N-acetyltransferase [Chloroflexi bacterium]|nr:GNAT family N-acetyltransferase [Chloroflexota bacterium]MDA1241502.1 GNAT family N-acetyltransferase [Chloroflexota bacterium]
MAGVTRGAWARGLGLTIVPAEAEALLADPGLVRALLDGIDRGSSGPLPECSHPADWYTVREAGVTTAIAIVRRDFPSPGRAALLGIAVAPAHRGRATATKAVLVIERKLAAEGLAPLLARVPRTNGRGLYFMLRTGFTPVPPEHRPDDPGDATWFARHETLRA